MFIDKLPQDERSRIKTNIERVLSEILSDRYDAKIIIKFEKKEDGNALNEEH